MTDSPFKLEYARPPGKYSRAGILVSWIIIVAAVASVAYANWRASRTESRTEATADFQISMAGRLTVGEARAVSGIGFLPDTATPTMLASLKVAATSPAQKLRIVPVIGEVQGRTAAMTALEDLAPLLDRPELKDEAAALREIYGSGPGKLSGLQRRQLVEREGWFGKLALSFGLPDSDPLRAQVLHRAQTTFLATISFELLIALAAIAGFALLVIAIIFLAMRKIRLAFRRAPVPTSALIESSALYLGGYILIGLLVRRVAPGSLLVSVVALLAWMPIAMLWPLLRGMSWTDLRGSLGWHAGRGVFREMALGITGYISGLPIIAVAAVITAVLASRSGATTVHPFIFSDTHGIWHIVGLYLLASVWAPIVEETMFRGALFAHLRQGHGWLVSAALSAFIFAALHPQGWAAIPVLGAIGFVFAGIREWRGTALASMTAHALNNAVATTFLIVALK